MALASASALSFLVLRPLRNGVTNWGRPDERLQVIRLATPRPMMRAAARFHGHHCSGRKLREPELKRLATKILTTQHPTASIHLANRKHDLGQINAHEACRRGYGIHGDFPFC
ncbi:MAG: hypothetical protein IPP82_14400 [Xanthomonadales bacterium]|nr:hypothetical protein [Xanthomonadales bacterium]